MKVACSIIILCLITISGYAQQVKYSFEEVSYNPREKTKVVTVYSSDIEGDDGAPKYKVRASIDITANKLASNYVYLSGPTIKGELCMSNVTHISHLYLNTPNTGGVEAYACRNIFTNVVFYFLVGATTSDTLKFLIYVPSGPQSLQLGN
ncbi:hypothetical protein [Spirosoma fluminis]